jgi:hypothetical protein
MANNCFVIMPFKAELGFLFRAIKAHVENKFPGVSVMRGDDNILTSPLLDKIVDYIRQSDVIIADCSARNPNVFYELGMAHALAKPVVLITSDEVEQAPTDIRAFEFVSYSKLDPQQFLARLEGALQGVLGNPFAQAYPEASALFEEFRAAKEPALIAASKEQFVSAGSALRAAGHNLPPPEQVRVRAEFLIRRLLSAEPAIPTLIALKEWLEQKYPAAG